MKNKLIDLKTKKEFENIPYNLNELKRIIEQNSYELFKIKLIVNDYVYEDGNIDYIEALGIDENNQLVIFEYKIGKLVRTISKGFSQIDYIKKHISQFKMLCNDRIGNENAKIIDYNPRLIVFSDHFHRYDYESIRLLPYIVEFNEVILFNDKLLINRTYVNRQSDMTNFTGTIVGNNKDLFIELRNYIFALGEEVVEYGMKNVICYRRMVNFVFVYFANGLHLCVHGRDILIDSFEKIDMYKKIIEEEYDKN